MLKVEKGEIEKRLALKILIHGIELKLFWRQ